MLNLSSDPYYDMNVYVHVVSLNNSVKWLLVCFYLPLYIFPHPGLSTGRKGEEDPGGSSMEGGSRGGESHLVGDIIRNVKYTAVKVHATIVFNHFLPFLHPLN